MSRNILSEMPSSVEKNPSSYMTRSEMINEDFRVVRLISMTNDVLRNLRKKELNRYDIHPRRIAVLRSIHALGNLARPARIAKELNRKRNTLTELLQKMENDGLVSIVGDPVNKNSHKVLLTKMGAKKLDQSKHALIVSKVISSLSKNEQLMLTICLNKISQKALEFMGLEPVDVAPLQNDEGLNLFFLIVDTEEKIRKARQKELAPYGITREQSSILLRTLILGDQATPSVIASGLLRKRNTISKMVSKLETQGIIAKTKDLSNKKKVHITLTEKGIEKHSHINSQKYSHFLLGSLSPKERKYLESGLTKLLDEATYVFQTI